VRFKITLKSTAVTDIKFNNEQNVKLFVLNFVLTMCYLLIFTIITVSFLTLIIYSYIYPFYVLRDITLSNINLLRNSVKHINIVNVFLR
jgi:hypothetical protein